jgi:hypothetical protein
VFSGHLATSYRTTINRSLCPPKKSPSTQVALQGFCRDGDIKQDQDG